MKTVSEIRIILFLMVPCLASAGAAAAVSQPTLLGSRLELLADMELIQFIAGNARFEVQKPAPLEVVLETNKPWEGSGCRMFNVIDDRGTYRLYYSCSPDKKGRREVSGTEILCYAESKDGINWRKPDLGLVEYQGSKQNNIIWSQESISHFTPFLDTNPAKNTSEKFKALGRGKKGLYPMKSHDGVHWSLIRETPVIRQGSFDTQIVAFWDGNAQIYREYHRRLRWMDYRDFVTSTSKDFLSWEPIRPVTYQDEKYYEHLYSPVIFPYFRAPQLFLGFPARFLPQQGERTEPIFMVSRNGQRFYKNKEPLIPLSATRDRGGNRSNYVGIGLVSLGKIKNELSIYALENYGGGTAVRLRRFAYPQDRFVSLKSDGDEVTYVMSNLIAFKGKKLFLNYKTQEDGWLRMALHFDVSYSEPGYDLEDCVRMSGDRIKQAVQWSGNSDVSKLSGKPLYLKIEMKNAELFSFRFK